MSDVRSWLNQKFLEWQNEQGQPMKQKEFAAYIGVKPSTYSSWVNDGVPPSGDNLHRLAMKLGDEIYNIVGIEPPTMVYRTLRQAEMAFNDLPPEKQQAYLDRIRQIIQEIYIDLGGKRVK